MTFVSPYAIAEIYAGLGDADRAFDMLDQAYRLRDNELIFLKIDPMADTLRSDPRFDLLLRRMHLAN